MLGQNLSKARRDVREHCTRVIQFPIPLQDKQGMKLRDTNNTDRIPLCALSHNFLRRYGYVAPGYRFYFQTLYALSYNDCEIKI